MSTRQLYTLRIFLPNGTIWTQTGLAYENVAAIKHVWDVVSPHLHPATRGEVILYNREHTP